MVIIVGSPVQSRPVPSAFLYGGTLSVGWWNRLMPILDNERRCCFAGRSSGTGYKWHFSNQRLNEAALFRYKLVYMRRKFTPITINNRVVSLPPWLLSLLLLQSCDSMPGELQSFETNKVRRYESNWTARALWQMTVDC